eukprot:CAMPEP_0115437616 /NCGR_PEP_ID=MMETSP0271-20121206/34827_1 /TAXON_ID=71861 /ORGANISM="Scrippsiella trochoidea, Strain CCMP3099" /LENGTH=83 /DNA_ID=CAMNT_0002863231 /DNA_START=6 /DNA_END=258 /DNA_ORIENTATION=-
MSMLPTRRPAATPGTQPWRTKALWRRGLHPHVRAGSMIFTLNCRLQQRLGGRTYALGTSQRATGMQIEFSMQNPACTLHAKTG